MQLALERTTSQGAVSARTLAAMARHTCKLQTAHALSFTLFRPNPLAPINSLYPISDVGLAVTFIAAH